MNNIPPENIFKSYDIRGTYPDQLNEENAVPITKAIYKLLQEQTGKATPLTIVVGRDMRLSTPALFKAVSETLVDLGARVIDLGIVPTTTFYYAVFSNKYDGGIQITASHNPKEYNGLKIVRISDTGLVKIGKSTGMDDIKKYSLEGVKFGIYEKGSIETQENTIRDEVEAALRITGNPQIKKFKIVADPANALGALYIEELFKVIPAELVKMNFELDGTFPAHQADPLQAETLVDLQKKVLERGADLGLAPDGDGDRLFFIDDKGNIVPPTIITALVAKELLSEHKGEKIVVDIRYIITPKKIVEESEGVFELTRVGHAFITEKLHQTGAIFAGESSAHYYFRETGNAESQVPIILMVLKVLTRENKKLSEIVQDLKRSHESGEINFKVTNAKELMDIIKEEFRDGELSTIDGIAVSYPDWRFSIRTSNTEPLLRLNIEAESAETVQSKKEHIIELIEKHAKKD